jgi:hypothetical protein
VLTAVDLHGQTAVATLDVEVHPSASGAAADPALRFGKATPPAHRREVQLAQRPRAVGDVLDQLRDRGAASTPTAARLAATSCGAEAMPCWMGMTRSNAACRSETA